MLCKFLKTGCHFIFLGNHDDQIRDVKAGVKRSPSSYQLMWTERTSLQQASLQNGDSAVGFLGFVPCTGDLAGGRAATVQGDLTVYFIWSRSTE